MSHNIVLTKSKFFEIRGSIYTIYNAKDAPIHFVQDKISRSYKGVIRGFHGDDKTWKLITCLYGKVKLVTYDIYQDIKSSYILSGEDKECISILVPPKTLNAHQCLTDECIFHYKWSEAYTNPDDQWSVRYNDTDINPMWDSDISPIVSDRDSRSRSLKELKQWLKIN